MCFDCDEAAGTGSQYRYNTQMTYFRIYSSDYGEANGFDKWLHILRIKNPEYIYIGVFDHSATKLDVFLDELDIFHEKHGYCSSCSD